MQPFFFDEIDVSMRFALTLMLFMELFGGLVVLDLYAENRVWFDSIARHIKGMPAVWMIQVLWAIVYFFLGYSYYLTFRDSQDIVSVHYAFDAITGLLLINVILNKMYALVWLRWRLTTIAIYMVVSIDGITLLMLVILGMNDMLDEMGYLFPYALWNLYLTYINITWRVVEARLELEKAQEQPQQT